MNEYLQKLKSILDTFIFLYDESYGEDGISDKIFFNEQNSVIYLASKRLLKKISILGTLYKSSNKFFNCVINTFFLLFLLGLALLFFTNYDMLHKLFIFTFVFEMILMICFFILLIYLKCIYKKVKQQSKQIVNEISKVVTEINKQLEGDTKWQR